MKTKRFNAEQQSSRAAEKFSFPLFLCLSAALVYVLITLPGCIPARTPPQLAFTPGPAVVVTDRVYETSAFTARYPDGWRVVTSAADAPLSVVFVAPDEISTITLQVGTLDEASLTGDLQTEVRSLEYENGLKMTAVLRAPAEKWADFLPVFEHMLSTVQPA